MPPLLLPGISIQTPRNRHPLIPRSVGSQLKQPTQYTFPSLVRRDYVESARYFHALGPETQHDDLRPRKTPPLWPKARMLTVSKCDHSRNTSGLRSALGYLTPLTQRKLNNRRWFISLTKNFPLNVNVVQVTSHPQTQTHFAKVWDPQTYGRDYQSRFYLL